MSRESRLLESGDAVTTNFNTGRYGLRSRHVIVEVRRNCRSQSGIMFRVSPSLTRCGEEDWYDADWFEPA